MKVVKYICDECKKGKAIYRVRIKIEKIDLRQKDKGWAVSKGLFCKRCAKILVKRLSGEEEKHGD